MIKKRVSNFVFLILNFLWVEISKYSINFSLKNTGQNSKRIDNFFFETKVPPQKKMWSSSEYKLDVWRERVRSPVWVKGARGCSCGLYTFLPMRILTKRPTVILRPFLESTHFLFSCLKNFFSRSLTKRPRAILRPFLESTHFFFSCLKNFFF